MLLNFIGFVQMILGLWVGIYTIHFLTINPTPSPIEVTSWSTFWGLMLVVSLLSILCGYVVMDREAIMRKKG